ncbi:MAG TPA: hypothetical protein PKH95_01870 [Candidatus Magasanikbacteria bacterium]|nr:hypothetical protein [Candidatus Magasanikbacteria bacterium]
MIKVLHIVPSAFDYFEKIRKEAFLLVDSLDELGFDNYVFTLQYEAVNKRLEKKVQRETKGKMGFEKIYNIAEIKDKMDEADIIHLHAPFLGMGKKILEYKKKNPKKKFIVTLHPGLPYVDFFTIIIWLYNSWYLGKMFAIADFVAVENEDIFKKAGGFAKLKDEKKLVLINNFINFIKENNPVIEGKLDELKKNDLPTYSALAYGELYRILRGE